jgi:uncharacterized membrane protein (UPF0136 family)
MRKGLPVTFGIMGGLIGILAAYFATRRTWLGDVGPLDWVQNLSDLNAVVPLVFYTLVGIAVGAGIGMGATRHPLGPSSVANDQTTRNVRWLSTAVIVYGIAVAAGGVMGFVEAKSIMSLLTGGLAGLIIIGAGVLSSSNPKAGYGTAAVLAVALTAFFIYRFMSTHKAMPAMGVIGLSVLMLILLVAGHFMKGSPTP